MWIKKNCPGFLVFGAAIVAFTNTAIAQVSVDVAGNFAIPRPPVCEVPCENFKVVPPFLQKLSEQGDDQQISTPQSRKDFLIQIANWRLHAENVRQSAEQLRAGAGPDDAATTKDYLGRIGYYLTIIDSYKTVHRLDKAKKIIFNAEN